MLGPRNHDWKFPVAFITWVCLLGNATEDLSVLQPNGTSALVTFGLALMSRGLTSGSW